MPMLVGAFGRQPIDALHTATIVAPVAKLPAMRAQAIAQLALRRRHARPGLVVVHGKLLDDLARAALGGAANLSRGVFERAAKLAGGVWSCVCPIRLTSTGLLQTLEQPGTGARTGHRPPAPNRGVLRSGLTVCTFGSKQRRHVRWPAGPARNRVARSPGHLQRRPSRCRPSASSLDTSGFTGAVRPTAARMPACCVGSSLFEFLVACQRRLVVVCGSMICMHR